MKNFAIRALKPHSSICRQKLLNLVALKFVQTLDLPYIYLLKLFFMPEKINAKLKITFLSLAKGLQLSCSLFLYFLTTVKYMMHHLSVCMCVQLVNNLMFYFTTWPLRITLK